MIKRVKKNLRLPNKTVNIKLVMGQKKIFIKPINDHTEKANTYRKRKLGLLKKAYELAILCGIEIKVMISDIDQYVHYFSSTEEANSKV